MQHQKLSVVGLREETEGRTSDNEVDEGNGRRLVAMVISNKCSLIIIIGDGSGRKVATQSCFEEFREKKP